MTAGDVVKHFVPDMLQWNFNRDAVAAGVDTGGYLSGSGSSADYGLAYLLQGVLD